MAAELADPMSDPATAAATLAAEAHNAGLRAAIAHGAGYHERDFRLPDDYQRPGRRGRRIRDAAAIEATLRARWGA